MVEVDPGKDPIYGIAEKSELYSDVPVAKAG